MKRFRNLLVFASGKDGGVAAIEQAAALAETTSARVTIIDCLAHQPDFLHLLGTSSNEIQKTLADQRLADLDRLTQPIRDRGVAVTSRLLLGEPAEKIIELVLSHNHDLLIKSAEQPAGLAQRMFGNAGQRLMRKCPCPVWIIKPPAHPPLRRILVAVDPAPTGKERIPMNLKIMEIAISLAHLNNAEFHIVYVWPRWATSSFSAVDRIGTKVQEREGLAIQENILESLVGRYRGNHDFTTHLLTGIPGDAIARLSADLEIDLLVMGTVCRNHFKFFAIGNTAQRVLDQVNCSVLVIKPETFLTEVYQRTAMDNGPALSFA